MKKLFTKTLTLLLAAAMLAGLCGCNSGSPDETTPDAGAGADADTDTVISVTEENTYSKPLPNLPEVPYWFPNDLLSWDPAQDPDWVNVGAALADENVARQDELAVRPLGAQALGLGVAAVLGGAAALLVGKEIGRAHV